MLPIRRVVSLLVDLAILASGASLGAVLPLLTGERGWGVLGLMLLLAPSLGVAALIAQVMYALRWRRTLGQRAMGLHVVDGAGQISSGRLFARMVLLVLLPTLVAVAAWGVGAVATHQIENWGTNHPDWQQRFDQSYAQKESLHDQAQASRNSDEQTKSWQKQRAAEERILALLAERDNTLVGRINDNADELTTSAILLWLLANCLLLFTRRGPLHDRICRLRVERA